jgi:alpha-ribazole phosphatase
MSIYLIRHTTPAIDKGICYGQTDLDVTESFSEEADFIQTHLPPSIKYVFSSPLIRCRKLAIHLFPEMTIAWEPDLMEIHCGHWEMKHWDDISKDQIDPWMNNFVDTLIPGGESYTQLYTRVVRQFNHFCSFKEDLAVVTHGGVIRSILSFVTKTPLTDSFKAFSLHYGCVLKLNPADNCIIPETLYNKETLEKEMHKPSSFYRK